MIKKNNSKILFEKTTRFCVLVFLLILTLFNSTFCQTNSIPYNKVISNYELLNYLKPGIKDLTKVYSAEEKGNNDEALQYLANYLKKKFSERYYFSWKNFQKRFKEYNLKYPSQKKEHLFLSQEQMTTFPPDTHWQLPFNDLKGKNVTAYRLRHLARQDKIFDIALSYYYKNEDKNYLSYFVNQVKSLDDAFNLGKYDNKGNGVYEYYRCGTRVINWMLVYNIFLASNKFNWKDQITLIKTFLHHGAELQKKTQKFHHGNHHTKGLVGLFIISTMFPEFQGTTQWQAQAINGIKKHLETEVNNDGFQFERSVHYHIGDIINYFYVYQLAKINGFRLPGIFTKRLNSMFQALVSIAQPNKTLPVLQDDTDKPWAEFNNMQDVMTLGAILFNSKEYRWFASNKIPEDIFWFIRPIDYKIIYNSNGIAPQIGSIALKQTGYYVMRNGWKHNDEYMIITSGLSKEKPDHQHGDMEGVEAYANGNEILPNYQVRYFLNDYKNFKNSWVKNVALVDSIPQGQGWIPNKGGSGFGKWKTLPHPKSLAWKSTPIVDYYLGTHTGYDSIGVKYRREIFFIKDGFWLVRDIFKSKAKHNYQQIWQGNYGNVLKNRHVRSTFENGSGLDLISLNEPVTKISFSKIRSKSRVVFNEIDKSNYTFNTLVYPFESFEERVNDLNSEKFLSLKNWKLYETNSNHIPKIPLSSNAKFTLLKDNVCLLLNVNIINLDGTELKFNASSNIQINWTKGYYKFTVFGNKKIECISTSNMTIKNLSNGKLNENVKTFQIEPFNKYQINR